MHVITIPEGISESIPLQGGLPLEAGKEYICTNAFAGLMMLSRWRVVIDGEMWSLRLLMKARPITFFPFDPTKDWNGKHIWLYRGGGFGDLLMLTPLIRELKLRWPKCVVHVACGDQHYDQFDGIDVILESIPIPLKTREEIDCLVDFEETVEGNPAAEHLHLAQLFASRMGIVLKDIKPEYHVKFNEAEWAWNRYNRNGLPRIGIQFMASAFYRSYPDMGKVLIELSKKAQVFLFGTPNQVLLKEPVPNIVNLMEDKLTYRESAAVASTCKVCVSPDSALVHLCSALDIPCVALYGPFPSALRVTSEHTFSFNGKAPCAPCFFHADAPDQFPAGMPCTEKKRCVALESIDPGLVIEKTLSLAQALESPG
jgi:ADP-heptose:LPS heptosyltransferase